jgi:hypothetical protein
LALAVKTQAGLDAIVGDVQHEQPINVPLHAFGIAHFS